MSGCNYWNDRTLSCWYKYVNGKMIQEWEVWFVHFHNSHFVFIRGTSNQKCPALQQVDNVYTKETSKLNSCVNEITPQFDCIKPKAKAITYNYWNGLLLCTVR